MVFPQALASVVGLVRSAIDVAASYPTDDSAPSASYVRFSGVGVISECVGFVDCTPPFPIVLSDNIVGDQLVSQTTFAPPFRF